MIDHSKFYSVEYNSIKHSLTKLKTAENDNVEHSQYVLDLFDHCLSEEESEKWGFTYRNHNLRYESQYMDLVSDLYIINESKAILEFDYMNMEITELINILDGLDQKEKFDFLVLLKNQYFEQRSKYYVIEDVDVLSVFSMIMTRELYSNNRIYFTKVGVSISSGFDLALPICLENEDRLRQIEAVCKNHELFIRSFCDE